MQITKQHQLAGEFLVGFRAVFGLRKTKKTITKNLGFSECENATANLTKPMRNWLYFIANTKKQNRLGIPSRIMFLPNIGNDSDKSSFSFLENLPEVLTITGNDFDWKQFGNLNLLEYF